MWSFSTLSHRQPARKASIKFINLYTKIYSLLNRKHTLPLAISLCAGSSADKKYVFPPPDDSSSLKGFGLNFSLKNLSSRKVYGGKLLLK